MKSYGITIIPYREFTDFSEAIDYVKNNPGKYVIKPSMKKENKELKFGGESSKSLLFVGEEDDGRDVIQVLNDYKTAWSKKIPYPITKKNNRR